MATKKLKGLGRGLDALRATLGAHVATTREILAALYRAGIRLPPAQRRVRPSTMPVHQP